MSRLIIVSNRVVDPTDSAKAGGLATAMLDMLRQHSGVWFGWNGEITDDETATGVTLSRAAGIATATLALTRKEYDGYYLGFANAVLWPICHYRLDLAAYDTANAAIYYSVSEKFARSLSALIEPTDLVWVHDYHLIPLGSALRAAGVTNRIGYFQHIPFPSPDVFAGTPGHQELMQHLFSYDLIGFQTERDLGNFTDYAVTHLGAALEEGGRAQLGEQTTRMGAFPIGIDPDAFHDMATSAEADDRIAKLQRAAVRSYLIGVDRLDYSKGLPERFRAFRRFLQLFPERQKTAVLMQVAPPTREELEAYSDIRTELEQLSGAINGAFGDYDWTPLRYVHRSLPRDTLAALFRGSKVAMVTPLRDGMNLVAKEYVAAQDAEDPGVLILSEFAGAAEDLREALIVNPYDFDDVARAINTAITMPPEERKERYAALMKRVRERDIVNWRVSFLDALRENAE